jgi:predicted PurR-regulated permease PerM
MKLHPVTIILGLLIFGHFFGIIGMLLATPITAILKTIVIYINDKYKIMEKLRLK